MIYEIELIGWRLWMFFSNLELREVCCLLPLLLCAIGMILCFFGYMWEDIMNMEEPIMKEKVVEKVVVVKETVGQYLLRNGAMSVDRNGSISIDQRRAKRLRDKQPSPWKLLE